MRQSFGAETKCRRERKEYVIITAAWEFKFQADNQEERSKRYERYVGTDKGKKKHSGI